MFFSCAQFLQISRTLVELHWARRRRHHDHAARCSSAPQERSLRALDLPVPTCECWTTEPQFTPHPPMVANSCPNPRAHKAEVHYQRGTLVESRPCWQVVPFPSQSPSFPYSSPAKPSQSHSFPPACPDEHHPTPETFLQSSLFPFS